MERHTATPVLLISPETGRLPDKMGPLARHISGKSGGLGEVVTVLCDGLTKRGIVCHLAVPYLKSRFLQENACDEDAWQTIRNRIDADKIHLANSAVFSNLPSLYAGDPRLNAAEFQKQVVNNTITAVRSKYGGRIIIHSHDWVAGGVITAYARLRGCPVLHTVHNIHTGLIPPEMFFGVDLNRLMPYLYFSSAYGQDCIDCKATAIRNASLINLVGPHFLEEIVENRFYGEPMFSPHICTEIRIKHEHGSALAILNAPSQELYPEHSLSLPAPFGPDDDVLAAKQANRVAFQQRTGLQVDPEAILLYWPSRLDPSQKGIQLLEDIAHRFVIEHGDVQIAIVGNGVGSDRTHEEICGRIAWSSGGKIAYYPFSESLSLLGFAAASDVFGASLYEPCGQIDQLGNLYGATATNRDTGGYHDKIQELTLAGEGAGEDRGNGFLFRDYDAGGLWYGLHKNVEFHRRPREVRERNVRRIMREARERYSVDRMIDGYVAAYERLNGGISLI